MRNEQHSGMISAKHISQLILDGEADKAIFKSNHCLEALSSLQPSDIVYIEPRMREESGHFCRLATAYENLLSTDHLCMAVLHRYGWFSNKGQGWSGVFLIPDHMPDHSKISTQSQLVGFVQYFQYIFSKCLEQTQASLAIFPTIRFLKILAAIRAIEENPKSSGAILGVMETDVAPDCDDQYLFESAFMSASELMLSSKKAFLVFAESDAIRDYLLRPSKHALDWTVRLNLNLAAKKLNRDVSDLRHSLQSANVRLLEHRLGCAECDQVLQL